MVPSDVSPPFAHKESSGELVARIRAGDQRALEELFVELYAPLLTYLGNHFGAPDVAEDAIQAVFIEIWNRHSTFDPAVSVRAYCFAAARNHMHKLHRTTERAHHREAAATYSARAPMTPDRVLDDQELRVTLDAAIAALPERAREVFYLVREDGLTYAEAARVLGVSINTVKTQLARVSGVLRAVLGSTLSLLILSR